MKESRGHSRIQRIGDRASGSRLRRPWVAGLLTLWIAGSAMGQPSFPNLEVKANFMLNFARFVTWPEGIFESEASELDICILADPIYAGAISSVLSGRKIRRREVQILGPGTSEDALWCHVVIIPEALALLHDEVIDTLGSSSILTISESGGFAQAGGVANLISREGKVRLEVRWEALARSALELDPRVFPLVEFLGEAPEPAEEADSPTSVDPAEPSPGA
jgi:hypothetical protein